MVLENTILYSGNNCDLLVITSAGNDGLNTQNANNKHWPSNSPFVADSTLSYNDNVIAVGALDSADAGSLAFYSNYSPRHIDLAAPGTVQIFNTNDSTNTLYSKSGTSFAAPQVSRIAALLFDEFPDASAAAVKFALLRGVDTLETTDRSLLLSGGRVNYQKARLLLQNMEDRSACLDSFNIVLSTTYEALNNKFASVNPNPFSNSISIQLFENNQNTALNIRVIDLSGKTIIEKRFDQAENISINTEDLPNGFYFVQLRMGTSNQVTKLLKFN
jgi:hypothetical protein